MGINGLYKRIGACLMGVNPISGKVLLGCAWFHQDTRQLIRTGIACDAQHGYGAQRMAQRRSPNVPQDAIRPVNRLNSPKGEKACRDASQLRFVWKIVF
jgi:hypothetical protein